MSTIGRPSRSISGVMLAFFTLMIPIALMSAVLLLTRVEVMLAETSRHQARTQARLLAQSALAIHQEHIQGEFGGDPIETFAGEIEGIGTYRLGITPESGGERLIVARGETISGPYRIFSEIRAVETTVASEPTRSVIEFRSQTVNIVPAN